MLDLGADTSLLDWYKVLEHQDLKIDTTVIASNVHRQRNKSLPWFWSINVWKDANVGAWMNDCRCISAVYRMHWLRAKAQKTRWIEEVQCLQIEMESAVRFFQNKEQFWQEKQRLIEPQSQPGHIAWAAKQSAMWHSMAIQADSRFNDLLTSHLPPEFAKVIQPHTNKWPLFP